MIWLRALAIWLLIAAAESVHGALRQWFVVPVVGDLHARQIGVFTGSALILLIAWLCSHWLGASTFRSRLGVGLLWVALMLAFEFSLGAALGNSLERMLADYDPAQGGLMPLGLIILLLAPALAAKWRARTQRDEDNPL